MVGFLERVIFELDLLEKQKCNNSRSCGQYGGGQGGLLGFLFIYFLF